MTEEHVTNPELSKRLRELGVEQDSEFYWSNFENGGDDDIEVRLDSNHKWDRSDELYKISSAFLSSELGDILPHKIKANGYTYEYQEIFGSLGVYSDNKYRVYYYNHTMGKLRLFHSNNEADARGLMLVYLLENSLINLK